MALVDRFKSAWNAFKKPIEEGEEYYIQSSGHSSYRKPDRVLLNPSSEKTIVAAVYNRIAMDVSTISVIHCRVDENGKFKEKIDSKLNRCLTLRPNIDQSAAAFLQDAVLTMLDNGTVAIVPVDTTVNINNSEDFDILSLRAGIVREWYPRYVKVDLYNDRTGQREDIVLPKETVAIAENPFYSVMNEPNSTFKRLVNKLNLLDAVDRQLGSGKLDLIIQVPYSTKNQLRMDLAEQRRATIEKQLEESKYGIAYLDGTEKIVQLNRSVENKLMEQVEYLTTMMYSQTGMSEEILNGTASADAMTNYYSRTVEPILSSITDAMKWSFLTPTARTQGQSIIGIRDPFKLISADKMADIADKFTRNEVLSSNEVRTIVGLKPVDDARADELRNKNLKTSDTTGGTDSSVETSENENENNASISNLLSNNSTK